MFYDINACDNDDDTFVEWWWWYALLVKTHCTWNTLENWQWAVLKTTRLIEINSQPDTTVLCYGGPSNASTTINMGSL